MLDYSLNEEEQKKFILSYKIKNGYIHVKLAKGKTNPILYSEKKIQELEEKMKQQVVTISEKLLNEFDEGKDDIKKIIKKKNFIEFVKVQIKVLGILLVGLGLMYIYQVILLPSIIVALIFNTAAIASFIVALKVLKNNILHFGYSTDILKNLFLSEFKEELIENFKYDPEVKEVISDSLIKRIEKTPINQAFNLGNADYIEDFDFEALKDYIIAKESLEETEEQPFTRKREL